MYNEDIKNRHIEYVESQAKLPPNYMNNLFSKIEKFEEKLNKDCCNWTVSEAIEYYKYLNSRSVDTLVVVNSRLSLYTQWCIGNSLVFDNQNHYSEITRELLMKCVNICVINKQFITREQLLDYIHYLENPCDKFIILAMFEGICGSNYSDIINAKTSSIDEKNNIIKLFSGKTIEISKELIKIAKESSNEYNYYAINGSGKKYSLSGDIDIVVKNRMNAKELYEISEFTAGRRIYTRLKNILSFLGLSQRITGNAILNSGRVWYVNKIAKENNLSVENILYNINTRKIIENKYGGFTNITSFLTKYKEYLNK